MANNGKSNGTKSKKMPPKRVQRIRGITQDIGRVTRSPFGDSPSTKTVCDAMNAFSKVHAPLPRAVGGYCVVRTTKVVDFTEFGSTTSGLALLGPMKGEDFTVSGGVVSSKAGEKWFSTFGIRGQDSESATGGNLQADLFDVMASSGFDRANVVPSAFSVQVMNTEPLQTADGVAYIGRSNQIIDLSGDSRTFGTLASELVSYTNPRLCSGGKLALRGVQVDAVPYDMNDLSDFCPIDTTSVVNGGKILAGQPRFSGFAPIFIYNPNAIKLQLLVTCEWRVRFDPTNPAFAAHTYYQPSSLAYWDRVLQHSAAQGNGTRDIVEVVNTNLSI